MCMLPAPSWAPGTQQANTPSQMPSRTHSGSDGPGQAATLLGCPPTSAWAPTLCAGQPCQADPPSFTQLPNPVRGHLPLPLHPQTPAFLSLTFALNYLEWNGERHRLIIIFRKTILKLLIWKWIWPLFSVGGSPAWQDLEAEWCKEGLPGICQDSFLKKLGYSGLPF